MASSLTLALLFLLIGLLVGGLLGLFFQRLRLARDYVARPDVERDYVHRTAYDTLQQQRDIDQDHLQEKLAAERELTAQLRALQTECAHLQRTVATQQEEASKLQAAAQLQFEQVANRLLDEKSRKFTDLNHQQLGSLLTPLREKIAAFEAQIERRSHQETLDRSSLCKEIEMLRGLNQQLSLDANSLAAALKGDNKRMGDWGEWQLETLLQRAGLEANLHYRAQSSFTDHEGRTRRPDFIINLPEDKQLIIDCKVSLVAYEQYCRAEDEQQAAPHLRAHLESLRRHVRDLSGKRYDQLYQINSPEYILLFVPIEPAFNLAASHDQGLVLDALDRNIILVTSSTLLATLRTVSYIWRQEKQQRNAQEIAYQSGLLYDKFVGFVNDLESIGQRIDQTQTAYRDAMNKLVNSAKFGDTLVGRAERLRALGARNGKALPSEFTHAAPAVLSDNRSDESGES